MASNPGQLRMAVTSPSTVEVSAGSKVPFAGSQGSFETGPTATNMTPQPEPSGASGPLSTSTPSKSLAGMPLEPAGGHVKGDLAGPASTT